MNQQRPRWQRPRVKPNSKLREALLKCRQAAEGLKTYADTLTKEADEIEARVAAGETEMTEADKAKWEKATHG